jgi:hypothetical protein
MNGVRQEGADYFDDLDEQGGILESKGLRDFEGITTTVKSEGAVVRMNCRHCNRTRNVVLEWPELIQIASNTQGGPPILPTGWRYSKNNQTAYVSIPCGGCGNAEGFSVHTTPEEAVKNVQQGLTAGFIRPEQVQHIQQQVRTLQQRGGR